MPGRIRREDIDEVRSRMSIVDVVSDHVTLKSAGVGSLKGLCPFHDERTPSFHVRPAIGRYHCFGCGEDGDVIGFVMAMDHTSFAETVERFAAQLGITLRYEDGGAPQIEAGSRLRLLEASKAAAEFFQAQLLTPAAEPGQRFLGERGFDLAAAQRFGVGFAPQSFEALRTHLRGLGFTDDEQLRAGLLSEGQRGPYDRFRGRLVWPIRDVTGATVGFGARRLLDDDPGPKYLNTPETAIYHKSQVLYGLDLAKRDISKQREAVIVEGYTDVMACHLAGVTTAIATCGTAFGVDHIKVLRRVLGDVSTTDTTSLGKVVFTFDPDEAGQKAASRAFAEEQRFAAQTFVAVAPDGLDPCDLRLQRGDDAVRRLVETRRPMFEFMLRRVVDAFDLETVEGRVQATRAAAPVLATIRDRALADGYQRQVAGWLGVEPRDVQRALQGWRAQQARQQDARGQQSRPGSQGALGAPARPGGPAGQAAQGAAAPPAAPAEPRVTLQQLPKDPATILEREAIVAMLQQGGHVPVEMRARGASAHVGDGSLRIVRDGILAELDHIAEPTFSERVAAAVPEPLAPLVRELAIAPMVAGPRGVEASVRGVVVTLILRDILREKGELLGQLYRLRDGDPAAARRIATRIDELDAERARMEEQR
ncbi:DNA primase [Agrococcus sp. SGAir0287]|uniref:DNA primase n=1 Tax=Agrococcus sp. SGAir0287 TaxID=2070347 RepID=UPI0010CCB343|nr:DNA primase [Agrococcus sp. SGAir0287]QCR19435.1 DNA primase [Agrococcus sp. SGAir0287]